MTAQWGPAQKLQPSEGQDQGPRLGAQAAPSGQPARRARGSPHRPPASLCGAPSPSSPAASLRCCMWAWARSPSSSTRLTTPDTAAAMASSGRAGPSTWPRRPAITWWPRRRGGGGAHAAGGRRHRLRAVTVLARKGRSGYLVPPRRPVPPTILCCEGARVTSGHTFLPPTSFNQSAAGHAPGWANRKSVGSAGSGRMQPLQPLQPLLLAGSGPLGRPGKRIAAVGPVGKRLPKIKLL